MYSGISPRCAGLEFQKSGPFRKRTCPPADYTFNLEGHADPRGNAESNMTLSMQRAESVRAYLVGTHGIGPQRLIAEGKGDLEVMNRAFPAAPENRRVKIVTNVQ